jgi:Mn2+-dependent serine/threonine protein kinase
MRVQHNNSAAAAEELSESWYSTRPRPTARSQWPDAVAYREAIQNPQTALSEPDLRTGEVVHDRRGLPVAYSGRFAVVFRLKAADGTSWALRCFTSPPAHDADRHLRYQHIARHLDQLQDVVVPFRFIDRGIAVGGQWYPVVAMRWAQGETLARFVENNLHEPERLRTLAGTLSALLARLEEAGVAHGDWQHDNLIVANGGRTATLVDYDGMYVPELEGQRGDEVGHPNYQHPARVPEHFGPGLDRFPCLVIQTALLALSREPSLWARYSDGESLLFKRSDFTDPDASPLFRSLREVAVRHDDETLADSVARLEDACSHGPDSTLLPAIAPTSLIPQSFDGGHSGAGTAPSAPSLASRAKWWMDAHPVGTLGTAGTVGGVAAPSAARRAPAGQGLSQQAAGNFAYLARLQHPDLLDQERTARTRARLGLAITAACLAVIVAASLSGENVFPFYLFFWVFNFAGFGYQAWPRKKVLDELNAEILKMEQQVENRRARIAERRRAMGTVATLPGVRSLNDYIDEKLRNTPINAVLRVPGTSAATLRELKSAGIDTVYHLHGRLSVPGVPSHVMDALQKWVDELRLEAAAEYRRAQPLPANSVPNDVNRLEQEMREFERERDRLVRERNLFPETSWSAYWRYLLGLPESSNPPAASP